LPVWAFGTLAEWCFGGLAPGLNGQWWAGDLFVGVHVWVNSNGLMVNFGYPTDYPRVKFNIQIHVHFILDRIRVQPMGQKTYPYPDPSDRISDRYPNPRIKLPSL
jgi:hypothetical protein